MFTRKYGHSLINANINKTLVSPHTPKCISKSNRANSIFYFRSSSIFCDSAYWLIWTCQWRCWTEVWHQRLSWANNILAKGEDCAPLHTGRAQTCESAYYFATILLHYYKLFVLLGVEVYKQYSFTSSATRNLNHVVNRKSFFHLVTSYYLIFDFNICLGSTHWFE